MDKTVLTLLLIFLGFHLSSAKDAETCLRCSEYKDGPCRLGHIREPFKCPPEDKACYEEYIDNGNAPAYRRGCAPPDWCSTQRKNHGGALKFCRTCVTANCNDKTIGARDPLDKGAERCLRCSEFEAGACRLGDIKEPFECPPEDKACYEEYIDNGNAPAYRRGCAPPDWCSTQKKNHGEALKLCRTCETPNCNNKTLGAKDLSTLMCYECAATKEGACQSADLDGMKAQTCDKEQTRCLVGYKGGSQMTGNRQNYARKCATPNACDNLSRTAVICKLCKGQFCNTKEL